MEQSVKTDGTEDPPLSVICVISVLWRMSRAAALLWSASWGFLDRKACLCILLHRDLLWCALLWCTIRSNGMPPQLPAEWFWVTGLQHGYQAGAVPGTPGSLCAPLIKENEDTRNWEMDPVWGQESTTLSWDSRICRVYLYCSNKRYAPSYKLLIERKNIFYGIL